MFSVWQLKRERVWRYKKLPFWVQSHSKALIEREKKTERGYNWRKQDRGKYVKTGSETWKKERNEYKSGESSGGEPSLRAWLFWPLSLSRFGGLICSGSRGGGGGGGGDLMMSCCGPSPSKGGPWKALLITTCDETGRTKTAVQKITAWELWVNLKYNKSAQPPHPHPHPLLHTHTHTVSN